MAQAYQLVRETIKLTMSIIAASSLATAHAYDPAAGDFSKPAGNVIRIMAYNVHNNFIYTAADDAAYARVIKAANPDIIGFQELDVSLTVPQIKARLESYFPGDTWYVYLGKADGGNAGVSNRNIICSRFPLSMTRQDTSPGSSIRGVCMALVDLPDASYANDLYLMVAHFKAGNELSDHESRQKHADALTNWMRDARTPGGSINLPTGTPMIFCGDTNLGNVGDFAPWHAAKTMLDGDIYDTGRYGPDSAPDWDATDNEDASPTDYSTGLPWTHSTTSPGVRIDRFYFTDSVVHKVGGFVLNTRTMSGAARAAAGVNTNDTSGNSDHLPIVTDFALGPDPNPPAKLVINEFCTNDVGTDDRTFLELKNVGGREINLKGPVNYLIKQSDILTGATSEPATENQQAEFNLEGVVPPGGLFVLYDGVGHSAGIASTIESRLPKLQRQDLPGFFLDNDNDCAMSLIERTYLPRNVSIEIPKDSYGWASTSPGVTKYFRLDSGNNRLVTMSPDKWTTFTVDGAASDLTLSRNPGNTKANTFADWTIGATSTIAQENIAPSAIEDWMMYP